MGLHASTMPPLEFIPFKFKNPAQKHTFTPIKLITL